MSDISGETGTETHEIFFGSSGRSISIRYGLQVRLSKREHDCAHGETYLDALDRCKLEGRPQSVIKRYFVCILRKKTGRRLDYHKLVRAVNNYQYCWARDYLASTLQVC